MPIGSRVTQKLSRERLKISKFCKWDVVIYPKRSLYTKKHVNITTTELMVLKGLKCKKQKTLSGQKQFEKDVKGLIIIVMLSNIHPL